MSISRKGDLPCYKPKDNTAAMLIRLLLLLLIATFFVVAVNYAPGIGGSSQKPSTFLGFTDQMERDRRQEDSRLASQLAYASEAQECFSHGCHFEIHEITACDCHCHSEFEDGQENTQISEVE